MREEDLSTPLSVLLMDQNKPNREPPATEIYKCTLGNVDERIVRMNLIENLLTVAETSNGEDLGDQEKCLKQLCTYDLRNANLR